MKNGCGIHFLLRRPLLKVLTVLLSAECRFLYGSISIVYWWDLKLILKVRLRLEILSPSVDALAAGAAAPTEKGSHRWSCSYRELVALIDQATSIKLSPMNLCRFDVLAPTNQVRSCDDGQCINLAPVAHFLL